MSKQKLDKPEEIASILTQHEAGLTTAKICRQCGISSQMLYCWKLKYAGIGAPEITRRKQLEDENRSLKQMVADQALDMQAMKTIIE